MSTTRKTPWLPMILCVVLLAAASIAGTWYYVTRLQAPAQAAVEPPAAPQLVNIAPLTVNLQNPQHEQRLLYVGFAISVGDKATQAFLQSYVPQIRSQLFKLLGEQDSTALMTSQGKSALAAKVLELVKRPLTTPQPELSILDVLYTDFIVQ
ncbi:MULTISPECIES: flagellar basal body-associated FliL family protein [Pseudomonas]|uniref:Flagellar protein FliL n=1 Tax=Pseudomonas eucalypticola TaxID=2599595 RepID=A0A7D5DAI6_9PSED|nr:MULTISPECIES: flagellar basal body-associated FliL family protein [Pseudomonas]QKZ07313.1 flagellar basal body-associated protein FliL [Pseudomonas eucalypticola]WAH59095.1 flagellar basal body-associated protein FliL [Pseudomonas silvicola]